MVRRSLPPLPLQGAARLPSADELGLKNIETLYLRAEFLQYKNGEKTKLESFGRLIDRFVNDAMN